MNSENLGARMVENGALNQKIWAPEAFRGSCEVWGFFRDFGGFLECLERFRTYS
jgi:hypothetical protein